MKGPNFRPGIRGARVNQRDQSTTDHRSSDPEKPVSRAFLTGAGIFLPAVIVFAIALVVILVIVL